MKRSWIDEAVIYQVNLRALAAREPRNAIEAAREAAPDRSPLAYLERSLPTLRKLGASVLYLMPLYPIGEEQRKGIGSPYAIRDFASVDPEFGSLEEVKAVLRRAHKLRFKVILDITPNHTSRDHVWTVSNPEYYVKRTDGSLFHDLDWTDTAKLDYRSPQLRRAMIAIYDFWLGCLGQGADGAPDGVDGFRLDMAHFINDLSFWDEALPDLKRRHASRELLFLAECYGTANNMGLFKRGVTAAYDDDFYKVCQYGYAVDDGGESVIRLGAEAAHNGDFQDKREAFMKGGMAGAMAAALMNYEREFRGARGPWLARYTDNHDEGRGVYRFGPGAVRAANAVAFLAPRTLPFILTGQEFGALNRPPIHDRLKPCDKGRRRVAGEREWSEPGIELEGNVFTRGVVGRAAWYGFYQTLIRLRRKVRELVYGSFELLDAGEEGPVSQHAVLAFERRLGRSSVRCAINLGATRRHLANAELFTGETLYGNLDGGRSLAPFAAIVTRVRLNKTAHHPAANVTNL